MDTDNGSLASILTDLQAKMERMEGHAPSRFVGTAADVDYAKRFAASLPDGARAVGESAHSGSLAKSILDVAQKRTDGMQPTWQAKALAEGTDSAGGYLLVPEIAQDVLMLIRNRTAVNKMPITTVEPTSKLFVMPAVQAGASASWLNENAAIPASTETFEIAATMQPRPLGALVAVSNRLLADAVSGNPSAAGSAESVIKSDLADLMAVSLDSGLLLGDAAGPAPKGILRATGTTTLPAGTIATNGSQVSYPLLVAIVGALQQASMPFNAPGWIFSGRTLTSLMSLTNEFGEPLLMGTGLMTVDPAGTTGQLLGYKFAVTNAISNTQTFGSAMNASTIIFSSDWNELWLGNWQQLAVDSSGEASYTVDDGTTWVSAYQNQQTVVRATMWADMAIRRPAAFVLANGILP